MTIHTLNKDVFSFFGLLATIEDINGNFPTTTEIDRDLVG